jgi:hypothetical protein
LKATDKQKERMKKYGIPFDDETTFEEAGEMLRDELKEVQKNDTLSKNKNIRDEHLLENSNWED